MIITTIDPVTGQKILHPEKHPFVVEGYGYAQTRIYFESEETRQRYLANESHDIYALAQSRGE
jgi:hypothetical protein